MEKSTELKSNSDSDSELDSEKVGVKFDAELMTKSESNPDNDSEQIVIVYKWLQMITNKKWFS